MLQIDIEFKKKVVEGLLEQRDNFTGSDAAFSKQWNINNAVFSRIKSGETERILKDTQWINIGRELNISISDKKLKTVRTEVLTMIEEDIEFCQAYSKARIFVDDAEIGKTFTARYLSRKLTNCFYVDCSQAKSRNLFVRLLAKTIGIDNDGKISDVIANTIYYLRMLPNPCVILDEVADLDPKAFLECKGYWNGTEGACGWYMIGADGLKALIEKGIRNKKVGYREIFSRFSSSYTKATPIIKEQKVLFYKKLITDVVSANLEDKSKLNEIVNKSMKMDESGNIGGLRRAESILILNS